MSLSIYSVTTAFLKHLNGIRPSITSLIIPILLWYMTSLILPTCGLLNWWITFPTSHILMVLDLESKCSLCFPLLLSDHSPSIFSKVNNGEFHVIAPQRYFFLCSWIIPSYIFASTYCQFFWHCSCINYRRHHYTQRRPFLEQFSSNDLALHTTSALLFHNHTLDLAIL